MDFIIINADISQKKYHALWEHCLSRHLRWQVFASVIMGSLVNGLSVDAAMEKAVRFLSPAIEDASRIYACEEAQLCQVWRDDTCVPGQLLHAV